MPHEIASAVIEGAIEIIGDIGSEKIRRRWGWQGCLCTIMVLAGVAALMLWALGAFGG